MEEIFLKTLEANYQLQINEIIIESGAIQEENGVIWNLISVGSRKLVMVMADYLGGSEEEEIRRARAVIFENEIGKPSGVDELIVVKNLMGRAVSVVKFKGVSNWKVVVFEILNEGFLM